MPCGTNILGLETYDKTRCKELLSDWCFNNNVNPQFVKIVKGYITGRITNYKVYGFNN